MLRRHWSHCTDWRNIIAFGSCTCVLAFNRFSGMGVIFDSDMHHPFEDTITYSQVVHQGQKLFSEFYPPSGLYAFFNGFFLDFFGGGLVENIALSRNLFFLFIALLLVFLLSLHVKRAYLFGFALFFCIFDYNRFAFILPIILLLSCPQLLRRKNLWLQTWFLTSYLHGLYYPVYGAAVALGFLPLGIYQFYCFVKCGELKREIKRPLFWLGWSLCLAPVLWDIPLLLGLLRHSLAMGSQTLYADGNARFGQTVWADFFPYIHHISLRLILYYLFSFMILPAAVWLCAALGLRLGKVQLASGRVTVEQPVPALLAFAGGIALLVSFSFTTVVLDENSLFSRSRGMLSAVAVLLLILAAHYLPKERSWYLILAACTFFLCASAEIGFFGMDTSVKLSACYTVPDDYVYTYDDPVQKWGHTFVPADIYDSVEENYAKAQSLDREKTYYNVLPNFGYYYLLDVKGAAAIENWTTCGYSATKENVETILRNKSIVRPVNPLNNYYLYHWLLASGEYIWDPVNEYFLPNDAGLPREQVLEKNRAASLGSDVTSLGQIAGSWGSSFDTLQAIFTPADPSYTLSAQDSQLEIDFEQPLDGTNADFLYLDLSVKDPSFYYILHSWYSLNIQKNDRFANLFMKRVDNPELRATVQWYDEDNNLCSVVCDIGSGKLLIPLGSGKSWLLHQHDKITISVTSYGKPAPVPDLNAVQFLKAREIEPDGI